jgi:hypothetical protein
MIYAATVKGKGTTAGTYLVTPQYTRVDGTDAPDIEALPVFGLEPENGDTVFCAEGINDFSQSMQLIFNDNGGAYPLIIASLEQILIFSIVSLQLKGKIKLGEGGKKMLLGETVQTWAQSVDAALQALYTWGATGVAPGPTGGINPFSQSPALQAWPSSALSAKHELD